MVRCRQQSRARKCWSCCRASAHPPNWKSRFWYCWNRKYSFVNCQRFYCGELSLKQAILRLLWLKSSLWWTWRFITSGPVLVWVSLEGYRGDVRISSQIWPTSHTPVCA
jgi:hypothetical protein